MSRMEDRLRRTFEAQVDEPPALYDPAGGAIQRAGVLRRRRRLAMTMAAVVVAVALLGTLGTVRLLHLAAPEPANPRPAPTRMEPPGADTAKMDMIVSGVLRTASGENIQLPDGDILAGYQVPGGWLLFPNSAAGYGVTGSPNRFGTDRFYFLPDGGGQISRQIDSQAIPFPSPDGRWLAAVGPGDTGDRSILVWRLAARDGSLDVYKTPVEDRVFPEGWLGDKLVLGRRSPNGQSRQLALWDPTSGPFTGNWSDTQVTLVLGPTPDGRALFVTTMEGSDNRCLAIVDPGHGYASSGEQCGLFPAGTGGTVPGLAPIESPSGHWAITMQDHSEPARYVDLQTSGRGAAHGVDCPVQAESFAWEDDRTYLIRDPHGVVQRCRVGYPSAVPVQDPRLVGGRSVVLLQRLGG